MSDSAPPPGGRDEPPEYGYPPSGYGPQGFPPPGYVQPGYYAPPKSRLVAGLLGIFLGGVGIHRFYLGFTAIGVIQIVVTIVTCGLGALWGFIEGILYLSGAGSFRHDADGRPLGD